MSKNVERKPGIRIFKMASAQGVAELAQSLDLPSDVAGKIYAAATGANLSGSKAKKGGKKSRRRHPRRRVTRRKRFT